MFISVTRRNFNHHLSSDDANYETRDEIMLNTESIKLIEKNAISGSLIYLTDDTIISTTDDMDTIWFKLM